MLSDLEGFLLPLQPGFDFSRVIQLSGCPDNMVRGHPVPVTFFQIGILDGRRDGVELRDVLPGPGGERRQSRPAVHRERLSRRAMRVTSCPLIES